MKSPRGFTLVELLVVIYLVELLVVISLIGLLSSVVFASVNSAREKARIAAGKSLYAQLNHVFGASAVGSWSFEEGTGTTVRDSSGENNNGTINGATWQSDSQCGLGLGGCLRFDGNDYIEVPNSARLNLGPLFSVSAWVNMNSIGQFGGACGFIITKGVYPDYNYKLEICNWDGYRFQSIIGIDGQQRIAIDSQTRALGRWYHVIQTYDGATVRLYVDGRKSGEFAYAGAPTQSIYPVIIGRYYPGGWYFDGMIDEVRVYTEALTAQEIGKLYAAQAPKYQLATER